MKTKITIVTLLLFMMISYGLVSAQTSVSPAATTVESPSFKFTPTPVTSHMMSPYTIEGMRARTYPGGDIRIRETLRSFDDYTRYLIEYPSDGLTITGIMHVPTLGNGPFPVVILNHGYIRRRDYWSGAGTWEAADYLALRGYMTIAPDYRSWGDSDEGSSFFHTGLVADVINLVSSLSSLPYADLTRIGMWGHSMGGGITTKVLTIDRRVKAAVLYAPNSSNDAELIERWGRGCISRIPGVRCNRADVLPEELSQNIIDAYNDAILNNEMMRRISPYYHLDLINTPVQIHIGTADGQTPPLWSENLYWGLLNIGKDVEYHSYRGQGHLFEGDDWVLFMERVYDFFNTKLGVRP
jgi:dipeptidyl aminopeptidase/acylaminoacyl peptidase